MRNKKALYARVLLESLQEASESDARKKAKLFVQLLKKRGDLKLAASILKEFAGLWKERKGKIASIRIAVTLSHQVEESLKKNLSRQGYVVEQEQDPALIGGVEILLGTEYLVDNSIRGRLQRIREMM